MEGLAYVDGRILDLAEATVPLNDRGYLLGDGVFETLRTSNGTVFRRPDHAARFRRGLAAIGLEAELEAQFQAAVDALVDAGRKEFGDELYLRVNASTGRMDDVAGDDGGMVLTGLCKRFQPYPLLHYSRGVHLVVSRQRKDSRSPASAVKSLSFLPYVMARREAMTATAHDALLLNEEGRVAEATTSNVFARCGDTVYAPGEDEGALDGVTRRAVLELLDDADVDVEERMEIGHLRGADEAWLTNTTGGVIPFTRFDDKPVGDGEKGDMTTRLSHALEELIRGGVDGPGA